MADPSVSPAAPVVATAQAVPAPPKTVYVIFTAEISPKTVESLLAVLANCANQGVKAVYLAISTPGGDVAAGMTLYNVMRGMPFHLTTHNMGNVDSIGNVVFLAGETRYASEHSTFMFHGVGFNMANQNVRLEQKNINEMMDNIRSNHQRMGAILKERTKIEQSIADKLFREAQTKDSAYAVGCGIVHEVRDLQIPDGSSVVSLVFDRQTA